MVRRVLRHPVSRNLNWFEKPDFDAVGIGERYEMPCRPLRCPSVFYVMLIEAGQMMFE